MRFMISVKATAESETGVMPTDDQVSGRIAYHEGPGIERARVLEARERAQ